MDMVAITRIADMIDTEAGADETVIMTQARMVVGGVVVAEVMMVDEEAGGAVIVDRQSIGLKKTRWRPGVISSGRLGR